MIESIGFATLVAGVLGLLAIAHIFVASYRLTTAIGGVVVLGVVAFVVDWALMFATIRWAFNGDPAAEFVFTISPIVGVGAGWLAGLYAT